MTRRVSIALLLVALAVSGCARVITGQGGVASGAAPTSPGGPIATPTPTPAPPPGPTDPATGGATAQAPTGSGAQTGDVASVTRSADAESSTVCQTLSDDAISAAFGGRPVTVGVTAGSLDCSLRIDEPGGYYGYVTLYYSPNASPRTVSGYSADVYTPTTFAGRPALRGTFDIIVALGGDVDSPGAVQGTELLADTTPGGDFPVLVPLLNLAVAALAGD